MTSRYSFCFSVQQLKRAGDIGDHTTLTSLLPEGHNSAQTVGIKKILLMYAELMALLFPHSLYSQLLWPIFRKASYLGFMLRSKENGDESQV